MLKKDLIAENARLKKELFKASGQLAAARFNREALLDSATTYWIGLAREPRIGKLEELGKADEGYERIPFCFNNLDYTVEFRPFCRWEGVSYVFVYRHKDSSSPFLKEALSQTRNLDYGDTLTTGKWIVSRK